MIMKSSEDRISEKTPSLKETEAVYNDSIWRNKMSSEDYSTLERRWRSRWDFAKTHIPHNSLVLDVGCGDGILGEFLIKESSCKVYGVDISSIALGLARTKGLVTRLCDASHDAFPFDDEMFDVVVMTCILEHIALPEHALKESKRVLRHGGLIVITIPNVANIKNRLGFLLGRMPSEFLHMKAGIHIRFWNYSDEFERHILCDFKELKVIKKIATLKNPKASSRLKRGILESLIKISPNLFGEYTHFLIERI